METANIGAREIKSKLVPKRLRERYNLSLTDDPVTAQFNLKLTETEYEQIRDRAVEMGLTTTTYIRLCIFAFNPEK